MAEMGSPEMSLMVPPEYIGGVFEQGRYGVPAEVYGWKNLVDIYDVRQSSQRRAWCFANMRVFSDGTLASPETKWKPVVDHWLTDLKLAVDRTAFVEEDPDNPKKPKRVSAARERELRSGLKSESKETEKFMKAVMAVSSSARAMEQSGGSAAKYVALITQSQDGDLDKQDSWEDFLLHKDENKLNTVISDPLVEYYYNKLLEDAGVTVKKEWDEDGAREFNVDIDAAREGTLAKYLMNKATGYKGDASGFGRVESIGFESYIEHLLSNDSEDFILKQMGQDIDDTGRWAAARLACDAFLVDKFTEWEYIITGERGDEKEIYGERLNIYPFKGWGGDPLRAVIEPSFLPRRIKRVYSNEDEEIMNLVDEAFRPSNVFGLLGEKKKLATEAVPVSMVGHLKNYARYNDALWRFIGGSRAAGIANWSDKAVGEDLPAMAELLDQVYGGINWGENDGYPESEYPNGLPVGKHIVGLMMARILETKALALTAESLKPDFLTNMREIFSNPTEKPFKKVLEALWGQDLRARSGFLVSLTSGRTRIVFKDNMFGAEESLQETWELLFTNDQSKDRMQRSQNISRIRFTLNAANALSKIFTKH